ncbi:TrbC/VirB2 family protein [Erythrobacter ani]|uniref:TrbC/VirB2 family protein n=1 Tax=Erythrobacter ani TaxID=2827235 RepID=A0ABS6SJJ1_9SPHN|nr:TrbC/VirB2 family protein [Erythrobacter ani]MBV7265156.1 TrbC/VirB2 family protein [Erythrobacter ani]
MAIMVQPSLIDPYQGSSLGKSVAWMHATLFGDIAIGLCVLAVAFLGLMLLTGRVPIRHGMRVVIGCFVLLGAPTIAAGLMGAKPAAEAARQPSPIADTTSASPRGNLKPAQYDPYAGASLRRD